MKKKELWILLAAVLGALLAWPAQALLDTEHLGALSALGEWLRTLSLSGAGGNALAWVLVLAVSALPALGLLWKGRCRADWLLLLAGGELLAGLYYLVNPRILFPAFEGLDGGVLAQGWGLVALGCVAGTLLAWALLRLLRRLESAPARLLPPLLTCAGAVYALAAGFGAVSTLAANLSTMAQGNTDRDRVVSSAVLLVVTALLRLLPQVLGALVLVWGGDLARSLSEAPFEENTVALAERVARRCAGTAKLSLLLSAAGNALQLVCVPVLALVKIRVQLPVLTLALCAVLFLLCRYFRQAKAVSDDNATII